MDNLDGSRLDAHPEDSAVEGNSSSEINKKKLQLYTKLATNPRFARSSQK